MVSDDLLGSEEACCGDCAKHCCRGSENVVHPPLSQDIVQKRAISAKNTTSQIDGKESASADILMHYGNRQSKRKC